MTSAQSTRSNNAEFMDDHPDDDFGALSLLTQVPFYDTFVGLLSGDGSGPENGGVSSSNAKLMSKEDAKKYEQMIKSQSHKNGPLDLENLKNHDELLLFSKKNVSIVGHSDLFTVKLYHGSAGCVILIESSREGRLWSESYAELSSCCENKSIQIPNEMVLDSLMKALANYSAKNINDANSKFNSTCLLSMADKTVLLNLKVPLGTSSISYNFSITPTDEADYIEKRLNKASNLVKSRANDVKALQNEMKEFRKELRDFKTKIEAYLVRDTVKLKEVGFTSHEMQDAGFATDEIKRAWSDTELRAAGFKPNGNAGINSRRTSRSSVGDRSNISSQEHVIYEEPEDSECGFGGADSLADESIPEHAPIQPDTSTKKVKRPSYFKDNLKSSANVMRKLTPMKSSRNRPRQSLQY